jgi:hypothetical protein
MITVQELETINESYSDRAASLVGLPPFFALDSRQ